MPSIENLDHSGQELLDHARIGFLYRQGMELKDWIRAVRLSLKLSQTDFGTRFFVTKGNVSAWEHGRHSPSFDQITRMSQMSGLPLPSGTKPSSESVTDIPPQPHLPNSNPCGDAFHSNATVITYEVVKGAVAGVLQALGVRYEDLVEDEGAARLRIEAALQGASKPAASAQPAREIDVKKLDAKWVRNENEAMIPRQREAGRKKKPA